MTTPTPTNTNGGAGGAGVSQGGAGANGAALPSGIATPTSQAAAGQVAPANTPPQQGQSTAGGSAAQSTSSAPSGSGAANAPSTARRLTDDPDVRAWQASYDRQIENLRRAAEDANRRAAAVEQQQREARLAELPPEEVAGYWRAEAQRVQHETQQREQQRVQEERLTQQAFGIVKAAGIDPADPDLAPYLKGGPTAEGVAYLANGVVKLQAKKIADLEARIETERTRAAQEALRAAGVAQVDTSSGSVPTGDEAKRQEFDAFRKSVRGKAGAFTKIQAKARELGLSV